MKKVKYILLVITCKKNFQKLNKLMSQQWFKEFTSRKEVNLLIATGGSKKQYKIGNHLYLKTPEIMANLSKKLFEAFSFIKKNYSFDYLIKCDDDITVKNFYKVLMLFEKRDYSGIIRTTTKKRALLWAAKNDLKINPDKHVEVEYALGTMFCISKKAFYPILEKLPKLVEYHTKHLAGNNDTIIGRAFEEVESKKELTKSTKEEIEFFKKHIIEDFDLKKLKPQYILLRLRNP